MFVTWRSHSFVGWFSFQLTQFQKTQVSLGEKRADRGLDPTADRLWQQALVVEVLHFSIEIW